TRVNIEFWDIKLRTTGSLLRVKYPEKTWSSEVSGSCIKRRIPHSTVHDVLHKMLSLRVYKIQMIRALKPSDQVVRIYFVVEMLEKTDASPNFLRQVCFLDVATFHVSGVVNRYNCRISGSQNPHVTSELGRGSPKVNVWAGLMHDKLIGEIFFSEKSMTGRSHLDILELLALPQLPPRTMLQQKWAPLHFCHNVRNHLDREMAGRLIGRY
ncbi:hypothetical protein B7P43_G11408, partial [Cryptotermes secundus]